MNQARQINLAALAPAARSFSVTTPSLNTAAQISTTRDCEVHYSVDVQISSLLLGSAQGAVFLEYADDSGFTVNVVTAHSGTNSTSGLLNLVNTGTVTLIAIVPAAKFRRIRTQTVTGTVAFTSRQGQEVLL